MAPDFAMRRVDGSASASIRGALRRSRLAYACVFSADPFALEVGLAILFHPLGAETMSRPWPRACKNELRRAPGRAHRQASCRPALEALEERSMPSVSLTGLPNWTPYGPAPVVDSNNNPVGVGAINMVAPDP